MRLILGLIVLALAGFVLMRVMAPPETPTAQPTGGFVQAAQCQTCHAQVFAEWEQSWHSQSWIDPDVRVLSNDFANEDCIDCHAPQDMFLNGAGQRALPRSDRRDDGVDCLTCHRLPQTLGGGMAGTIDNPAAACQPQTRTELGRVEFCGSCHNQHNTVDQWRASRFAVQGPDFKDCRDCHMPERPDGSGRNHTMHGGHDMELIRSALRLDAQRLASGEIQVSVENFGVGHSFPTDERSRASDLFWREVPTDPETAGGWHHLYRFRSPYRSEVDIEPTLLEAGTTYTANLPAQAGRGAVQVALFYKLTPYFRDPATGEPVEYQTVTDPFTDAQLVFQVEVPAQ
ncbi:MAG: cytochrome c3 family protein [Planctomycetota bacterium]